MHEMSIALEICRIAEDQVGRSALGRVREVAVEVGRRAGVEVDNLEFCLEELLSRPPFGRARPVLIRRPGDVLRVRYLEVDEPEEGAEPGSRAAGAEIGGPVNASTANGARGGPR